MRLKRLLVLWSTTIILASTLLLLASSDVAQAIDQNAPSSLSQFISQRQLEPVPDTRINAGLAASMVSTLTIVTYEPYARYIYDFTAHVQGMPAGSYRWMFDEAASESLSNIAFDWEGGDGCAQQSMTSVICRGSIDYFSITYRFSNTLPALTPLIPLNIFPVAAGTFATNFTPDHRATLNYIEPLSFITSTNLSGVPIIPVEIDDNRLVWQIDNTDDGIVAAFFNDPRVSTVYLPITIQ